MIYSLIFPITHVAIHSQHIVIGFIHNAYHATATGIMYGILLVICVTVLKVILCLPCFLKAYINYYDKKLSKMYIICFYLFVSVTLLLTPVISGFLAYVVGLYIELPINVAFDEAPNRIVAVYQSVVVIFFGFIAYWLAIRQPESYFDHLIAVKDKDSCDTGTHDQTSNTHDWKVNMSHHLKEEQIARIILSALENLGQSSPNTAKKSST